MFKKFIIAVSLSVVMVLSIVPSSFAATNEQISNILTPTDNFNTLWYVRDGARSYDNRYTWGATVQDLYDNYYLSDYAYPKSDSNNWSNVIKSIEDGSNASYMLSFNGNLTNGQDAQSAVVVYSNESIPLLYSDDLAYVDYNQIVNGQFICVARWILEYTTDFLGNESLGYSAGSLPQIGCFAANSQPISTLLKFATDDSPNFTRGALAYNINFNLPADYDGETIPEDIDDVRALFKPNISYFVRDKNLTANLINKTQYSDRIGLNPPENWRWNFQVWNEERTEQIWSYTSESLFDTVNYDFSEYGKYSIRVSVSIKPPYAVPDDIRIVQPLWLNIDINGNSYAGLTWADCNSESLECTPSDEITGSTPQDQLSSKWQVFENGPLDSLITIPIYMLSTIKNGLTQNCNPLDLSFPIYDKVVDIKAPCMRSVYSDIGLTPYVEAIGSFASVFMLYNLFMWLYKTVDEALSFKETNTFISGGL